MLKKEAYILLIKILKIFLLLNFKTKMKVTSTIDLEKQIDFGWMWFLLSKF